MGNNLIGIAARTLLVLTLPVLFMAATGTFWPVALWLAAVVLLLAAHLAPESPKPYLPTTIESNVRTLDEHARDVLARVRADFPELHRDAQTTRTRIGDGA